MNAPQLYCPTWPSALLLGWVVFLRLLSVGFLRARVLHPCAPPVLLLHGYLRVLAALLPRVLGSQASLLLLQDPFAVNSLILVTAEEEKGRWSLSFLKGVVRTQDESEAAAKKSITEVGPELVDLVEQLIDIVKNLQSQRHLPESGRDNELSSPGTAFSGGMDLSLASPKVVTSNTPERKVSDILHDLEEILGKLRENFTWKEALDSQTRVEVLEAPSSSSCPLPDQSRPTPKRASRFAQWAISPTFDLRSLSCSLGVSQDCRTVTVSHDSQSYPWSHERFATCQVLCSQAFSSGHQYWEVDTQHCSHWAVGVASWGMSRDHILGRTKDSWCVEWKGTSQLSVWHMVKETVLGSDRPKVVGIWLDLEEGKLAFFYSVATQEQLLYECSISASSPLHPAFWLYGLRPGNSLTIRQVKV
nr:PREDICTED: E3 ubiquitin-protein ligase RNF135 [Equus przewalskii]